MKFTDAAVVAGTRRREDGSLVADARIARTGIQLYRGIELGKPEIDTLAVYRPGSEVFSEDTMKSAAHRPITNDHPADMVTTANWKQHAVGQTGDEIAGEGIYIRVPLLVSDETAIKDIEGGKRELSAGYTCTLDWTRGKTPAGDEYDAIQKDIRINHVAIVRRGRAGPEIRIGDDAKQWGASPVTTQTADERTIQMDLRKVLVDGLQVETTDAGAQAITKLLNDLASSAAKLSDPQKTHDVKLADLEKAHAAALAAKDAVIATKDKELAAKDAAIDAEKAKVLSDADLDKKVAARAQLVTVAKAIAKDVKTDGLSDAAIRKAVVAAALGDAAIKDKADAYIDARFEIMVEDATKKAGGGDAFRDVLAGGLATVVTDADKARLAAEAEEHNAWKSKAA